MDGRRSDTPNVIHTDVCIVGAGPAGLTTAVDLVRAGIDTVVVEAGSQDQARTVETADAVGLPYPLARSRKAGVGGSGHCWDIPSPTGEIAVRLRALDPLDMADRPGLRSGWPLGWSDLEPWWAKAWSTFGVGPPPASTTEGSLRRVVFGFGPASTFTARLPDCLAASSHARMLSTTSAVDIRTDGDSTAVTSVVCVGPDGPVTIVAKEYVLAGGGVENARLLLASRSKHEAGLANHNDQVGRCFMEHPHYASGLLIAEDGGALLRQPRLWDVVAVDGRAQQRMYALDAAVLDEHGLPDSAFYLVPRPPGKPVRLAADGTIDHRAVEAVHAVRMALLNRRPGQLAGRQVGRAVRAAPGLAAGAVAQAAALRAARRGGSPRGPVVFTLAVMAEQLPFASSRVRLTGTRDSLGVPRAALDWRVAEPDWDALRRRHELIAPELARLFGARVLSLVDAVEVPHLGEGYHHMGTTRMSTRPEEGVVDADCRVHGVPNLSIAGSSVFPTVGFSNPTLTIVALAHRLAHRLVQELAGRRRQPEGSLAAPPDRRGNPDRAFEVSRPGLASRQRRHR